MADRARQVADGVSVLLTTQVPGGQVEVQFINAARLAAVAGVVEAIDWQPDDPRLPELADRLAALISAADNWEENATEGVMAVDLLDSFVVDAVPVARRLMHSWRSAAVPDGPSSSR